jgi:hypothetical protein
MGSHVEIDYRGQAELNVVIRECAIADRGNFA